MVSTLKETLGALHHVKCSSAQVNILKYSLTHGDVAGVIGVHIERLDAVAACKGLAADTANADGQIEGGQSSTVLKCPLLDSRYLVREFHVSQ